MTPDPLDQMLATVFKTEIDKLTDAEMVYRILGGIRRRQRRRDLFLTSILTLALVATLTLAPFSLSFLSQWLTFGLDHLLNGSWIGSLTSTAPLLIAAALIPWLFAITDEAV